MVVALVLALAGPAGVAAQELTISAAISMKEAVEELGRRFVKAHPGMSLRHNFASSGVLQQQIDAGAPIDLFVSAAQRQMEELERRGLILPATRRVFARNVLVVVTPGDSRLGLMKPADLAGARVTRIAVGNPRTVPAGQYAEESLRALGLWASLQPRLVLAENVRQVLDYVARGEVEAGFVYATDAIVRAAGVREAFRPAEDTYRPILYLAAVVRGSRHPALGQAFIELLLSAEGRSVLGRLGFSPPPPASSGDGRSPR